MIGQTSSELSAKMLGQAAQLQASQSLVRMFIPVRFDASEFPVESASTVLYTWDLSVDGTDDAFSMAPVCTHAFTEGGAYAVRVRITDAPEDEILSDLIEIVVLNRSRAASFSASSSVFTRELATFADQLAAPTLGGQIVHVASDLGDGTFVAEEDRPRITSTRTSTRHPGTTSSLCS